MCLLPIVEKDIRVSRGKKKVWKVTNPWGGPYLGFGSRMHRRGRDIRYSRGLCCWGNKRDAIRYAKEWGNDAKIAQFLIPEGKEYVPANISIPYYGAKLKSCIKAQDIKRISPLETIK